LGLIKLTGGKVAKVTKLSVSSTMMRTPRFLVAQLQGINVLKTNVQYQCSIHHHCPTHYRMHAMNTRNQELGTKLRPPATATQSESSVATVSTKLPSIQQNDQSEIFQGNQPENLRSTDPMSVTDAIAQLLEELGVRSAFGVAGGAMASLWYSLSNSQIIEVINCRHEGGAAFAATEAHFVSNLPVVVFTTAGPGITNALTGLFAARGEGAKIIFLSACTSAPQRGRGAIQETSDETLPHTELFTAGSLFHYGVTVESVEQLPQIARRLQLGLAQPGSFIAHISIPTNIQSLMIPAPLPKLEPLRFQDTTRSETIAQVSSLLSEGSFAIWLGFGARHGADAIRQLAERTGAAVMCSPRAKGIFPEDHPQFVGVTGLGGHQSVITYMQQQRPLHILVLGTRLGEPTSFWSAEMLPIRGFIHVDIDATVAGMAYPSAKTLAIQSDVNEFVSSLLTCFPTHSEREITLPRPEPIAVQHETTPSQSLIHPEALMSALQEVIDGTDAIVLAESGNSFTWATHCLRFNRAGRYRVSTGVGAMGHAVTGVIGAAHARSGKAIAIVGDGAMLMNNEISTAVKYQIPAVWIVLNDARYGMCAQGMAILGLEGADANIPQTDFVAIARGMGAEGVTVANTADLKSALTVAMSSTMPFVVDVQIDPSRLAPSKGRNQGLAKMGGQAQSKSAKAVSFPVV
jgi:thiamine pyrophosphate-dependent acetolactate synthase large subunit-like protein